MNIDSAMKRLCSDLALELIPKSVATITTAAGVPIDPKIIRIILQAFIVLLTEEESYLSERLETLLASYYKGAIDFLTDSLYLENVEARNVAINRARELFNQAIHIEKDPLLKGKCQFYMGVCYDLQNEKNAAKRWYEISFKSASELAFQLQNHHPGTLTKLVDGVIKPINSLDKDHGEVGNAASALFVLLTGGPITWIPIASGIELYENHKKRMDTQRQMELERILSFMNSLVPVLRAHGLKLLSE